MKETRVDAQGHLTNLAAWNKELPGILWLVGDLRHMGIKALADFKGKDPEELYARWCQLTHDCRPVAKCFFRCAVYLAGTPDSQRNPELCKWWNWA